VNDDSIAWNFASLAAELVKVGYKEKSRDSSDRSGACILNRLFAASMEKKGMIVPVGEPEPIPEDEENHTASKCPRTFGKGGGHHS
jgi:hypothetical protein